MNGSQDILLKKRPKTLWKQQMSILPELLTITQLIFTSNSMSTTIKISTTIDLLNSWNNTRLGIMKVTTIKTYRMISKLVINPLVGSIQHSQNFMMVVMFIKCKVSVICKTMFTMTTENLGTAHQLVGLQQLVLNK